MNKNKKKKVILGTTISSLFAIAIILPSVLYANNSNRMSSTYVINHNINAIYCKQLTFDNANTVSNDSAQLQYSQLNTCSTSLINLINGDDKIDHGNYLIVLANQANLVYQAIAYNNFLTSKNLADYKSSYNSILYNALAAIGWNIPVYQYIQFPVISLSTLAQSNMNLYQVYKTYAPSTTKSPTLQDNLFNNLMNYTNKIINNKTSNNPVILAYVNGKASFWSYDAISTFISNNNSSSSSSSSNNNPLTLQIRQNMQKSYKTSLDKFLETNYNDTKKSATSSNSNSIQNAPTSLLSFYTKISFNKN